MFFQPAEPAPETLGRVKRRYCRYRLPILSFFLGTLLNVYTVFFFKSSSLLVSFSFMLGMIALLFLNEFGPFQRLGLAFKFVLLSLCGLSFCAAVVPIAFGRIGVDVFLASMRGSHALGHDFRMNVRPEQDRCPRAPVAGKPRTGPAPCPRPGRRVASAEP